MIGLSEWVFLAVLVMVCGADTQKEEAECVEKWTKKGLTKRFTQAQLEWMCHQQRQMRLLSASQRDLSSAPSQLQLVYLDSISACSNGLCSLSNRSTRFNSSLRDRDPASQQLVMKPQKALRKEYRTLSDKERQALHDAFNRLKTTRIDGISKYDLIASWHFPEQAPGAHTGPAFLPWHREYLRRMEVALRNEVPDVALPYWDSTLDHDLPDPRDSVLWTESYFGNGNGHVTSGPFANWQSAKPLPEQKNVDRLFRGIGTSPFGALYRPSDLDWLYSRQNFAQLTMCVDPTFELTHGLVHVWVGGYMLDVPISTTEPVFFFHHSFVDYIWERFRQTRQSAQQRVSDWPAPEQTCAGHHDIDAPMRPFAGVRNRDGLSEEYLRDWYGYADSPSKCNQQIDCQSSALWCHVTGAGGRCRAKIRPFGNCAGLDATEACYLSTCKNGICLPEGYSKPSPFVPPVPPKPQPQPQPQSNRDGTVFIKSVMFDENGPVQTGVLEVTSLDASLSFAKKASPIQAAKYPEYPALIYAPVPDPALKRVKVQLSSTDSIGRSCRAFCRRRSNTGLIYSPCDGTLTLSSMADSSDPIPFTPSESIRPFLDADISQHPSQWTVRPPYIGFLCGSAIDPAVFTRLSQTTKPNPDKSSDHVWFHVLVMDGRTPLDRTVPGATITVISLDNQPYQYKAKVESTADFPRYNGVAYVRAPNPANSPQGTVRIHISAADPFGKACKPVCDDGGSYDLCKGNVTLSIDDKRSHVFSFSSDDRMQPFLGWDLTDHPTQWRRVVSALQFLCYI